eukprot:COSAG02_NODE_3654_length_6410_cov_11.576929_4_plen_188_part_00
MGRRLVGRAAATHLLKRRPHRPAPIRDAGRHPGTQMRRPRAGARRCTRASPITPCAQRQDVVGGDYLRINSLRRVERKCRLMIRWRCEMDRMERCRYRARATATHPRAARPVGRGACGTEGGGGRAGGEGGGSACAWHCCSSKSSWRGGGCTRSASSFHVSSVLAMASQWQHSLAFEMPDAACAAPP